MERSREVGTVIERECGQGRVCDDSCLDTGGSGPTRGEAGGRGQSLSWKRRPWRWVASRQGLASVRREGHFFM